MGLERRGAGFYVLRGAASNFDTGPDGDLPVGRRRRRVPESAFRVAAGASGPKVGLRLDSRGRRQLGADSLNLKLEGPLEFKSSLSQPCRTCRSGLRMPVHWPGSCSGPQLAWGRDFESRVAGGPAAVTPGRDGPKTVTGPPGGPGSLPPPRRRSTVRPCPGQPECAQA